MNDSTDKYVFRKARKYVQIPVWNVHCRDKYRCARQAFLKWLQNGRVRHGQLYTDMVVTRKSFVSALKYCKRNKEKISDSILAASFHGKRSNIFWKEVKKRRPANKLTATN